VKTLAFRCIGPRICFGQGTTGILISPQSCGEAASFCLAGFTSLQACYQEAVSLHVMFTRA